MERIRMPSRRSSKANRSRRQPPQRRVTPRVVDDTSDVGVDAPTMSSASTSGASTAAGRAPGRASTRTRSRAPAQIVIANYDFLRHDLRILGMLAPTLVVILVILSITIK